LVAFFESAHSSWEENGQTIFIPVVLSQPAPATVTITCSATGGSAVGGGVDYLLTGTNIVFNPGETRQMVTLTITDDQLDESYETIELTLSDPINAPLGPITLHTCTIMDGDHLPSFTNAAIKPTSAFETSILSIETQGWSDADGDAEGYHYQWKRNGVAIIGTTDETLFPGEFTMGDTVSCTVTAWDGANEGNSIEADIVISLVTISTEELRGHLLGRTEMTGDKRIACDVNQDGKIDIADLIALTKLRQR
jgi:hypothetical protein